jgi:hypothetical protein
MFNFKNIYPKEDDMKKLLVLALVLSLATVANAALTLSVSDTELLESETAIISITGDGSQTPGAFFLGVGVGGPGSLLIDTATILYTGNASFLAMESGLGETLGFNEPYVNVSLNGVPPVGQENPPLTGLLVDGIVLHCDGVGEVVISLYDGDGNFLDSKTITQTPEPITVGLLGLGALFLRRRK